MRPVWATAWSCWPSASWIAGAPYRWHGRSCRLVRNGRGGVRGSACCGSCARPCPLRGRSWCWPTAAWTPAGGSAGWRVWAGIPFCASIRAAHFGWPVRRGVFGDPRWSGRRDAAGGDAARPSPRPTADWTARWRRGGAMGMPSRGWC